MQPDCIVELGTHRGFSFFAFCHALRELGLPGKVHAIDTWAGDAHAGYYGEEIFSDVAQILESDYPDNGIMHRQTFDAAVSTFADQSIDILHIDGLHTYDAARHDFESWLGKVKPGGIVLLHDTFERRKGFGVWKLWEELKPNFPHFEFHHSHGLGVIGVGSAFRPNVQRLFEASSDAKLAEQIRQEFSTIGGRYSERLRAVRLAAQVKRMKSSLSWQLTDPFRKLGAQLKTKKAGR